MLGKSRPLYLFRTLPNITTGANLTLTILLKMLSTGALNQCEHLVINWDGASDNVNKTAIKVLCWLLISAEKMGWPLRTVTLLRLCVGHTHDLLDATWAILAQLIYGIHSCGDALLDILDWNGNGLGLYPKP